MIIFAIFLIIATITTIVYLYRQIPPGVEKLNYIQIFIAVALVFLGFSLTLCFDAIKQKLNETKERDGIVKMLQFELAEMQAIVGSNLKAIQPNTEKDIVRVKTRSLMLLNTAAWETAKLKHNTFITNTGDLFKLVHLYAAVHVANEKIRARESFRLYNQAATDFQEKMTVIDSDIKQTLEKLLPYHTVAQEFLHSQYPFVVEGYSFTSDAGIVVNKK